jgi:hypothetical protein
MNKKSATISLIVLFIAAIGSMALLSSCKAPSRLVASWSGNDVGKDSLGTNNGTLVNVTFTNGMTGQAFHFNGSDACVRIPDAPELNPTNGLSLEVWVLVEKYPGNDGVVVVGKDWPWAKRQYMIALNSVSEPVERSLIESSDVSARHGIKKKSQAGVFSNRWAFRAYAGLQTGLVFFDGATVVQTNTWYHVVMTYDNTALRLFVNGKLDGSLLASGYILSTPNPLLIGGFGQPPWTLLGRVDKLNLYARALSADEIQSRYHAGNAEKH